MKLISSHPCHLHWMEGSDYLPTGFSNRVPYVFWPYKRNRFPIPEFPKTFDDVDDSFLLFTLFRSTVCALPFLTSVRSSAALPRLLFCCFKLFVFFCPFIITVVLYYDLLVLCSFFSLLYSTNYSTVCYYALLPLLFSLYAIFLLIWLMLGVVMWLVAVLVVCCFLLSVWLILYFLRAAGGVIIKLFHLKLYMFNALLFVVSLSPPFASAFHAFLFW